MGPEVALVDSAETLADAARDRLDSMGLLRAAPGREGQLAFHLSDLPWKFTEIGARFLGKPIAEPVIVGLDEMEAAGKPVS
jgi:glutamate racemase